MFPAPFPSKRQLVPKPVMQPLRILGTGDFHPGGHVPMPVQQRLLRGAFRKGFPCGDAHAVQGRAGQKFFIAPSAKGPRSSTRCMFSNVSGLISPFSAMAAAVPAAPGSSANTALRGDAAPGGGSGSAMRRTPAPPGAGPYSSGNDRCAAPASFDRNVSAPHPAATPRPYIPTRPARPCAVRTGNMPATAMVLPCRATRPPWAAPRRERDRFADPCRRGAVPPSESGADVPSCTVRYSVKAASTVSVGAYELPAQIPACPPPAGTRLSARSAAGTAPPKAAAEPRTRGAPWSRAVRTCGLASPSTSSGRTIRQRQQRGEGIRRDLRAVQPQIFPKQQREGRDASGRGPRQVQLLLGNVQRRKHLRPPARN